MQPKNRSPRIALFDIETSPILAHVWQMYETNVIAVERPSIMLSWAAKWLGENRVTTRTLNDYPGYKKNRFDDKPLVTELHQFMGDADIIVAHNGDQFDVKKSNTRFAIHDLPPPAPYKTFDTLKAARRTFKFDSNKLNTLGQTLGLGRKIPNTGIDLWLSCLAGDGKAWRQMAAYNRQDVILLERLYLKLRPWAPNHPDLNSYSEKTACPTCQSTNVQRRGYFVAQRARYQKLQCQNVECGKWFKGSRIK